jgi:hypothetical protein
LASGKRTTAEEAGKSRSRAALDIHANKKPVLGSGFTRVGEPGSGFTKVGKVSGGGTERSEEDGNKPAEESVKVIVNKVDKVIREGTERSGVDGENPAEESVEMDIDDSVSIAAEPVSKSELHILILCARTSQSERMTRTWPWVAARATTPKVGPGRNTTTPSRPAATTPIVPAAVLLTIANKDTTKKAGSCFLSSSKLWWLRAALQWVTVGVYGGANFARCLLCCRLYFRYNRNPLKWCLHLGGFITA